MLANPDPDDPNLPPYDYVGDWQLHTEIFSTTKNSMAYRYDENAAYCIYQETNGDKIQKFSISGNGQLSPSNSTSLSYEASHIVPAGFGGVFVAGIQSGNLTVAQYDSVFNQLWSSTLTNGSNLRPQDMFLTKDGGLAVVARYLGNNNSYPDYYLVKMDTYGDTLWRRWWNSSSNENCYVLAAGMNGGLLAGLELNGGVLGTGSPKLAKLDVNGTIEWEVTFTTADDDLQFISDIRMASGGEFLVAGETYEHGAILIRYSASGTELWRAEGPAAGIVAMSPTPDGGFVVLGSSISDWIERQIEVWEVNSSGTFEYTNSIGGPGTDNPGNIAFLKNGSYLISGLTNGFGGTPENNNHTFYIRVDLNGEIMNY